MPLRMRRIREVLGKQQQEVEAETGIPKSWISRVENGKAKNVNIDRLRKIAECYGCTVDDLIEKEK